MKMETCIEVAARIWCDKAFQHIVMDSDAAMKIAKILYFVANSDANAHTGNHCWENEGGFIKD